MRVLSLIIAITLFCLAPAPAQVIYGGQSIPTRPAKPSDSVGVDNSWYWDFTTGGIYGPKDLGHWPDGPAVPSIVPYIPITNYGAKFDAKTLIDGTITGGSTTYTSPTANFTSNDCNTGAGCTGRTDKVIDIDFAGPSHGPLHTHITSIVSPSTVKLADPASFTNGYSYTVWWRSITPQSGVGSYAPGDTLTLIGGVGPAATATVTSTLVQSATIITPGSGAVASDGTGDGVCEVAGTTGTNETPFIAELAITGGIPTAVNSLTNKGVYFTNPTSLTAEPVVPTINCSNLAGTVLSLKMGVKTASVGFGPTGRGEYTSTPGTTVETSTSGSGTGFQAQPLYARAGNTIYGTDDSQAFIDAFNASYNLNVAGQFNCLIMPGGATIITTSTPLWRKGPCIRGQAREKTQIFLAPTFIGPFISVANTWFESTQFQPGDGALPAGSQIKYGTRLTDFAIFGTHYAPNPQEGIVFYDENDFANVERILFFSINGSCLSGGTEKTQTRAFLRESYFHDIQMHNCGSATEHALFIHADGRGTSDDLYFTNIDIYASTGVGVKISANAAAQISQVHFDRLRIETLPFGVIRSPKDSLVIGDSVEDGQVSAIIFDKTQLIGPQIGTCAVRLTADTGANAPFSIMMNGTISGGDPYGNGLCLDYGRINSFQFNENVVDGNEVVFSSTVGQQNQVQGIACNEREWTYSIVGPNAPTSGACYTMPGNLRGSFSYSTDNSTSIASGTPIGPGSVLLSFARANPSQVPAGGQSASIASLSSKSTGLYSFDAAANQALLTGTFTQATSSYAPKDNGWFGSRILSFFSLAQPISGNQYQETILGCQTAATNAATCRLTSDGTGIAAINNVAAPGNNIAWSGGLTCTAHDSTGNNNSISWYPVQVLLQKQNSNASLVAAFGTVPTPLKIEASAGTTAGAALTPAADTTNGGMSLIFTAPTVNASVYVITCHAPTTQTH